MATNSKTFFVTGTDTEVGKTFVAASLLSGARSLGKSTLGLKPIAAGCQLEDGSLRNDDAKILRDASSVELRYEDVNPFALEPPIAPHIAAEQIGLRLSVLEIAKAIAVGLEEAADITLIEGAGGMMVPLNERESFIDLCGLLKIPVVLVVGLKLGCINHALLTVDALQKRNIELAAWVGNSPVELMREHDANVGSLIKRIPAECLGIVPPLHDDPEPVSRAAEILEASKLLG